MCQPQYVLLAQNTFTALIMNKVWKVATKLDFGLVFEIVYYGEIQFEIQSNGNRRLDQQNLHGL